MILFPGRGDGKISINHSRDAFTPPRHCEEWSDEIKIRSRGAIRARGLKTTTTTTFF
jgi:hypothetical protein